MIKEFELINKFFKPLTNENISALNLSDDCCYLESDKNKKIVISKDILVEDIHFNFSDGAKNIASKLLLSNLSDLASSGALAKNYLLGFSLDERIDGNFCHDFSDELKYIQDKFNISLIGGDSVRSNKGLFFSIVAIGEVEKGKELLRKNAENNDLIFVTGNIGDSYLGLKLKDEKNIKNISTEMKEYFLKEHFSPFPPLDFSNKLSNLALSKCATDISDGLLRDLQNICDSSNLEANIFLDNIPFSDYAKKMLDIGFCKIEELISGGEDYQLIFSAKKENEKDILQLAKNMNIKLNIIGNLKKSESNNVRLFQNDKEIKINKLGYEH